MHINVVSFNMADFNKYTIKDFPLRNSLMLTAIEYNQFVLQFQNACSDFKNKLNERFKQGVPYPYAWPEFDTTV